MAVEATTGDNAQWNKFVKIVLEIDACIEGVMIADNHGGLITSGGRENLPEETKKWLKKIVSDKGRIPALVGHITDQAEEYFGERSYNLALYQKCMILTIPFKTNGIFISLLLAPYSDSRSIATQVEKLLSR